MRLALIIAGCVGLIAGAAFLLAPPDDGITEIVSLVGRDATPDDVRLFIAKNSIHKIDDTFRQGKHAAKLVAYAKGESTEPAHMECATRSNLMQRVLNELGYRTRKIVIFDTDTNLNSHTFIDVLNPQIGQWETQDADYNVYWQRGDSRVSLADFADQPDAIEPCGRDGCGWDRAKKLQNYLDIISTTDKATGKRFAVYTKAADLKRVYTKGNKRGTFCVVEAKRCADGFMPLSAKR